MSLADGTGVALLVLGAFVGALAHARRRRHEPPAAGCAPARGKRRLGPCGRHEPRQPRHIARRADDPAGSRRKDGGTITTTTLADTIKTVCDAITLNYGTVKSNVRYYDFEYPNANRMMLITEWI